MTDPQDVPLSAAQRSRIRRLSAYKEPDAGEVAGELNVVPYLDIITNIMMFVLASVSVTFIASIDTTPPAIGGKGTRQDVTSKALNLAALITDEGVALKAAGASIGPGCELCSSTKCQTIERKGDKYDLAALTECARKLKNAKPDFKDETQVTISASNPIEYKTVIDVMDALRSDGTEELFPEVHFGVVR
jgi:biopolymer transport protein ExbD